ncbi:class I SAM-dependent methyltransferase [Paenibacillus sp. GXUN7292]|uniref:class I SAM-dependent methyltransferase n=1 Tax=Paenibacillus sp. GXUN7292 TaxID=3422499 RepID=UPI003D7CFC4D
MKQNDNFGHTKLAEQLMKQIESSQLQGWRYNENNEQIPAKGITFYTYMKSCLYDPMYGYYMSGETRIGKMGDFYTSSAIGTIFAEILAANCLQELSSSAEKLAVIEWGAGTGKLSFQMAEAANRIDPIGAIRLKHWLIDDHAAHRQAAQQQSRLSTWIQAEHIAASAQGWELLAGTDKAIIIANELLDAFSIHRVQRMGDKLVELGVTSDEEKGFRYMYMPLSSPAIVELLERDRIKLHEGQITEVNLDAEAWLLEIFRHMRKGKLILIDYGHEAEEFTAEYRMNGTLMCYHRHLASDQPFLWAGQQDITAQVCFTSIRHAAEQSGFKVSYYNSQKQFLIDNGLLEMLADTTDENPFSEANRKNRAIRQLLLSDQMSELFKVIILEK